MKESVNNRLGRKFNIVLFIVCVFVLQEHKCVLDSCRVLESEGFDVTYLPVQANGIIDMEVRKVLVITRSGGVQLYAHV